MTRRFCRSNWIGFQAEIKRSVARTGSDSTWTPHWPQNERPGGDREEGTDMPYLLELLLCIGRRTLFGVVLQIGMQTGWTDVNLGRARRTPMAALR
jgi:hypothetical protein